MAFSKEDKMALTKPLSLREVRRTLFSIPQGKSLGQDGLNVKFYLFYCNIIGDYLFQAINQFFNTALLPPS